MRRDKKSKYRRERKDIFLGGVQDRLGQDVSPYIRLIKLHHARTKQGIGFWALLRMIIPPIEAVSTVLYRGNINNRPIRLLGRLGVPCPNLTWEMFRHALIHGDGPRNAVYRGHKVIWEVRIGGGHQIFRDKIALDAEQLYSDFQVLLTEEYNKALQAKTFVWVEDEVWFRNKVRQAIKDEFRALRQLS